MPAHGAALRLLSAVGCLCLYLPSAAGPTSRPETSVLVSVKEGGDAILPCSHGDDITALLFDWRKAAQGGEPQKEVFMYHDGTHYNNGLYGQSPDFRGRVSFFEEQLKHGNASILIGNAKMADAGNYSCAFPLLQTPQTFYLQLLVDVTFRDRSAWSTAAVPAPVIKTLVFTATHYLFSCEVRGSAPRPKVQWQDEEGKVLETGRGDDITVNFTVTQTGRYRCVATQDALKHRVATETAVFIGGGERGSSFMPAAGWLMLAPILLVVFLFLPTRFTQRLTWARCLRRHAENQKIDLENQKIDLENQKIDLENDAD